MSKRGYSMVELLLVMLLLCMFGLTVATLTQAGTTAYNSINDNMQSESDARTALNYLTVKVKQNDAPGMVCTAEAYNAPALVIRENFGGVNYNTWIFFINGELREAPFLNDGVQPSPSNSELIALTEGFSVRYDEAARLLRASVDYKNRAGDADEILTLESTVHLRSGGAYALE